MIKLIVKNGLTVPKDNKYITDIIYKKIKKDLVVINPAYLSCIERGIRPVYKDSSGKRVLIPKTLSFMKEYGNRLELPAGYYERLSELLEQNIELKHLPCTNIQDKLSDKLVDIELFDCQAEAIENMLANWCGILSSPAASGKTIMGINLITKLGLKALWLVHLDRLVKQTAAAFLEVTDCNRNDVKIMSKGKYKVGKVFTAAIVDTARKYSRQLSEENFGVVIVDECHRAPTKKTYDVLMKLSPSYLYGLSATPYRSDGLDNIMKYMLGTHITEIDRKVLVEADIIVTPEIEVIYTNMFIKTPLGSQYPDFMEQLVNDTKRNVVMLYEILEEAMKGNVCLVLSERVEHCRILNDMLSKIYPYTEVVNGRTKDKEADRIIEKLQSNKISVLYTTYQFLGEGFDSEILNRLFLCTPFRDDRRCEQAVGRIQRTYKNKNNKTAKLYDFADDNRVVRIQLDHRLRVYDRLGCNVSFRRPRLDL